MTTKLPPLPEPMKEILVAGDHDATLRTALEDFYSTYQMEQYATDALALTSQAGGESVDFDKWYGSVDARFWNNYDACKAAWVAARPAPRAGAPPAAVKSEGNDAFSFGLMDERMACGWGQYREAILASAPRAGVVVLPKVVAYEYLHDVTGRTALVEAHQVECGWEKNNPQYSQCGAYLGRAAVIKALRVAALRAGVVDDANKPVSWYELIDDALESMELRGMHGERSYQNLKAAMRHDGEVQND